MVCLELSIYQLGLISLIYPIETLGFFTIHVSFRLSNRSLRIEEQKKIHQKLSPVGLEPTTS